MSYNKTMREIPKDKIDGAEDLFKFLLDKENGILKWKGALRINRYFEDEEYWDSVRKKSFLNENWKAVQNLKEYGFTEKGVYGIKFAKPNSIDYFYFSENLRSAKIQGKKSIAEIKRSQRDTKID